MTSTTDTPAGQGEPFADWVILELLGHRRLAGYLSEQEVAGAKMLRIDIPGSDGEPPITQLYSPAAVYAITPTTEELARRAAALSRPRPISRWELEAAAPRPPYDDVDEVPDGADLDALAAAAEQELY